MEFIAIKIYFLSIINDILFLIKVLIKVYIIENLRVNILININILTSYKFLLDYIS